MRAAAAALGAAADEAALMAAGAVRDWLSARLDTEGGLARLARTADLWERLNRAVRETYNLERKPLFSIFGQLAEAERG